MNSIYVQNHGQLALTDLTLELFKVIVLGASNDLFFNLEVNPLGQALQMDSSAWARTGTWVEHEIVCFFCLLKTDLTLRFPFVIFIGSLARGFQIRLPILGVIFHDIPVGIDSSLVLTRRQANIPIYTRLTDKELNSSQFNNMSWLKFIA